MRNKILVVDDNVATVQMLSWAMEMCGHDVRTACDGPNAVEIAHAYKPDAILLDLGMPEMDGYEVCRELKQDPNLQDTLFIAQTGWAADRHRRLSKLVGFHHHLVKPIDLNALQELLAAS